MRPKHSVAKKLAEAVVKDIRRATRRQFSAEDKIRIVLEGLRGETALLNYAARKASLRACNTPGRRNFWKLASAGWPATPPALPQAEKYKIGTVKHAH
jgi:transposase-like protein